MNADKTTRFAGVTEKMAGRGERMRKGKLLSLAMIFGGPATRCVALIFTAIAIAAAQTPAGAIAGVVQDPAGAAVPAARVKAVSNATGVTRIINTSEQGEFDFASLLAGDYEISVEASGF